MAWLEWVVKAFAALYLIPDVAVHRLKLGTVHRSPSQTCVLTFDDGPDPKWTPQILKVLRERSIKATFFVLGQKVERYPEIARAIAAEGHEIGLHGYVHIHPWLTSPLKFRLDMKRAQKALNKAGIPLSPLFRPPWGYWSLFSIPLPGFKRVMWSLPGCDWKPKMTPDMLKNWVVERASPGCIVLLHDGADYSGKTAEALPKIIDELMARGYKFITVSEALSLNVEGAAS